jgi:hypothetical protein
VIPGTLLGVLFLAGCLVPGFVFLRAAERRRAPLARSSLIEAVELASIGAATSLVAAMIVLGVGRWLQAIEPKALVRDSGTYLVLHPFRGLGSVLVTFLLSCLLAWLAAFAIFFRKSKSFEPAGTTWANVIWGRLSDEQYVAARVELTDGRHVVGKVLNFTAQFEPNRELALGRPLGVQAGADKPLEPLDADFLLLREDAIANITGSYRVVSETPPALPSTADANAEGS